MAKTPAEKPVAPWRQRLFEIIFESDTPAGKAFDVALIWFIIISVGAVMLESIGEIREVFGQELLVAEWIFTILFTIEYFLRLICVRNPKKYATSFFGLVDLFAILPTYISVVVPGAQTFLVIRAFRFVRIFRIFKLSAYFAEGQILVAALKTGRPKIMVFLVGVGAVVISMGALMYFVEGEESGFTSIPKAIYWTVTAMTTVGFGDIVPKTALGQLIATALMITGYGVIAIPTGIVTTEMVRGSLETPKSPSIGAKKMPLECDSCGLRGHDLDARFCRNCGHELGPQFHRDLE
jgi:voltage-gated potassium channel